MKGRISNDTKIGFGIGGLEVATLFAGLLVVIGLLMESGPDAWVAIVTQVWPHREVSGNVLVTIGVFAEVSIGVFIARSAKRAEILAGTAIAEANERAGEANRAAGVAEAEAGRANQRAAELEDRAAESRNETEGLRKANIEAGEKLESERRERLALEAALSPRDIGDQMAFARALGAAPKVRAVIDVIADAESRRLQGVLGFALRQAGWTINAHFPVPIGSALSDGIVIVYSLHAGITDEKTRAAQNAILAATTLRDLLNDKNVETNVTVDREVPLGELHILIGFKPTPWSADLTRKRLFTQKAFGEMVDRRLKEQLRQLPPKE